MGYEKSYDPRWRDGAHPGSVRQATAAIRQPDAQEARDATKDLEDLMKDLQKEAAEFRG